MRKFMKTCHVISRVFLYLSVIGILLLYFFKPGVLEFAARIIPSADNSAWLALVTTISVAAVMFAAAELAYKGLTDNEFMLTLSDSVLKPAYRRYDLSDKRFSKPEKDEFGFNASLRDVTDEKERVMRELAWEKQNSKKLQKKTVGNKIVMLIFFIAGLVFFFWPVVCYPVTGRLMRLPVGTAMDYFSLVALVLSLVIVLEIGNNRGHSRRLNTVVSIRTRSDELSEKPALPAAAPQPVFVQAAPAQEAPKPAPAPMPVSQAAGLEAEAAPAVELERPEEGWKPEPAWTGVPEDPEQEKTQEGSFVNLTPEKEQAED